MKKSILLFGIGTMLLFAACKTSEVNENSESEMVFTPEEVIEENDSEEYEEEIICSNGEIEIVVSKDWYDRSIVETTDSQISFYHKATYEEVGEKGFLFAVVRADNMVMDIGYTPIAYTNEHFYYFMPPEDIPELEDGEILLDYLDMVSSYSDMKEKIHINAEGAHFDVNEYILPMSHVKEISDEVLDNMFWFEYTRAVSEIYARRGLKFEDQFLYEYFIKYSWYTPSVEEADFDESMLSEIEKKNIEKLFAKENERLESERRADHLAFGKEYSYDLDGDGANESFCLRYEEGASADKVYFSINQQMVFECEEYNFLSLVGYYLTDIDENKPGLEIAVRVFGEELETVMYFYTYDGSMNCIGTVPVEFTKENEQENLVLVGFDGRINTSIRADVFFTCYADAEYVYSYEEKKIELVEQEMYAVKDTDPYGNIKFYELTEDIMIFKDRNVDSERITLKAQNVYFMESDLKEWMKVKGEDGVIGYLHKAANGDVDGVGKSADEIFMHLPY